MNRGRCYHSSCYIASNIYTFCGLTEKNNNNSVEKLPINNQGAEQSWQLMLIKNVPSRLNAVVSPLNNNKILIAGGVNNEYQMLDDVYIYDIESGFCTKSVIQKPYSFDCEGNSSTYVDENKVVALVRDKKHRPKLIEFQDYQNSLTVSVIRDFYTSNTSSSPRGFATSWWSFKRYLAD